MAAREVQLVRDKTGMSFFSGCTDALVSNYTRVVCVSALQQLSGILCRATGFSLAFDSSTLHSLSYLDVRVKFALKGSIKNFHILALPLYSSHTRKNMCDALSKLMTAVCPRWRNTLVGVSTDGEPKMTGSVSGLATRIDKETTKKKVIRIWCGLHQLDIVMQREYKAALSDAFEPTLTAVIGHLRRQQLLVARMKSTCPNVANTRWLSMDACTSWLSKHIVVIQDHYRAKTPPHPSAPYATWWVLLFAVNALAQEATAVFTQLQGLSTILSEQHAALVGLAGALFCLIGMEGPLTDEYITRLTEDDRESMEVVYGYVLRHSFVEAFILELDTSIEVSLEMMPTEEKTRLCAAVAMMYISTVVGILNIGVERDSTNSRMESVLPVLPHQLVQVSMPAFNKLLATHRSCLEATLDAATIHEIGQEFNNLRKLYRTNSDVLSSVNAASDLKTTFEDGWSSFESQFLRMQQFCGDLASAFPNTSTVESDFSVIGWEKSAYRQSLTDFYLEGVLHAKQYQELQNLSCDG